MTASLEVIYPRSSYQAWGYVRFKAAGKTTRLYVGKVTAETRQESLELGWQSVRAKGVIEKARLSWVTPQVLPNADAAPAKRKGR